MAENLFDKISSSIYCVTLVPLANEKKKKHSIDVTHYPRVWYTTKGVDFPQQNTKTPHVRLVGKFLKKKTIILSINQKKKCKVFKLSLGENCEKL